MSSLIKRLFKLPAVRVFKSHADDALTLGLRLTVWVVPAGLFAGWMAFPALTPSFKESIGIPENEDTYVSSVRYEETEIDQTPTTA